MKSLIFSIFVLFSISLTAAVPITPNPEIAKGGICTTDDPDFREFRYREHIPYCKRKVAKSLKRQLYTIYGIPRKCQKFYTIDHIIPLSIGGNNGPENLWPEHRSVKATRQNLEYEIYQNLRDGKITQEFAVRYILTTKYNPQLPPNFNPNPNCPNIY